MIRFAPIASEEIEKFLLEENGLAGADAGLLASTSRGSLGRALATDVETY